MDRIFAQVDAIVLPTPPCAPPLAAEVDIADRPGMAAVVSRLARLTRPASILGLPALSLPAVMTGAGPLSLQIVAPRGTEARLCALAQAYERAFALVRPVTATDIFGSMLQQETT